MNVLKINSLTVHIEGLTFKESFSRSNIRILDKVTVISDIFCPYSVNIHLRRTLADFSVDLIY